jgi:hypothetical protein
MNLFGSVGITGNLKTALMYLFVASLGQIMVSHIKCEENL